MTDSLGAQQRAALKDGERFGDVSMKADGFDWPRGENGKAMLKVTAAAAELIPTVQFGNVTVGPCSVTRFVEDLGEEEMLKQISKVQTVCELAVAEERLSVQALMRAHIAQRPA